METLIILGIWSVLKVILFILLLIVTLIGAAWYVVAIAEIYEISDKLDEILNELKKKNNESKN